MTTEPSSADFDDWLGGVVNRGFWLFRHMFDQWQHEQDLGDDDVDALNQEFGVYQTAAAKYGSDISEHQLREALKADLETELVKYIFHAEQPRP